MKRVYFATPEEEGSKSKPRLCVVAEMAGGQAGVVFAGKQLSPFVKREELLRGFERALPDGRSLKVQAFPIERPSQSPLPAPEAAPRSFEPYRVRAWLDGAELREALGYAGREDARAAMILLLLVGLSELALGMRLYPIGGATRFLVTGPVFLLGALGAWRRWSWALSLSLIVAVADTAVLLARTLQHGGMSPFLTVALRLALILSLWRASKSRA